MLPKLARVTNVVRIAPDKIGDILTTDLLRAISLARGLVKGEAIFKMCADFTADACLKLCRFKIQRGKSSPLTIHETFIRLKDSETLQNSDVQV